MGSLMLLSIKTIAACLSVMMVLVLTCQSSSCFISDCPQMRVRSTRAFREKRMFTGIAVRFPKVRTGQQSRNKLKSMQKRDLRFLYNILYNADKKNGNKNTGSKKCIRSYPGCKRNQNLTRVLVSRWPWLFGALENNSNI